MPTIHTNFVSGTLSADIGNSDTVINSAGFANLDVVTSTDVAKFILDPFGENGPPEIVYTTGHTASATTITGCQRGREGTEGRTHVTGVTIIHAPVASDWLETPNAIDQVVNNPGGAVATGTPVTIPVGGTNTEGTSSSLSRADHLHQLQSAAPTASTPADTVVEGTAPTVARSDHTHAREGYFGGTPSSVGGTTGAPGTSPAVSRGDHTHPFTPGSLNNRAAFGTIIRPIGLNDSTADVVVGDLAVFDLALHRWDGTAWAPMTPCNTHVISMSSELQNGWTGAAGQASPARYRAGQEVVLSGCVAHGSNAFGTTITTLAANWRPTGNRKYQVPITGPILGVGLAFTAALTVFTDGRVFLEAAPLGAFITTQSVSLDGIRFITSSDYA